MRSEGEPVSILNEISREPCLTVVELKVQMGDQIVLESKKYNVFMHLTTD